MGLGGSLRRWLSDPVVALGTCMAVSLSLVLLAAGPIYADAVAVGALRRSLTDEPAAGTAVEILARVDQSEAAVVGDVAVDAVETAFGGVDHDVFPSLVSTESFELPTRSDAGRVDLAAFAWLGGVADEVTVTGGDLPVDAGDGVEVAVDERAAVALGLEVGRRLVVTPRSGHGGEIEVRIVGVYAVDDPSGDFWIGRERLVEPMSVSSEFRTVTLLTAREPMATGLSERPLVGVLAVPRFEQIGLDDLEPLRRRMSSLEATATGELRRRDVATTTGFEVDTTVSTLLSGRDRTLTVARSVVIAVVLQLAVLGAVALVLVAGLAVDARHAESTMLRARGAGRGQLVGQAVLDAAVIVIPVAAIAPHVAARLVGTLDDVGPLASNRLTITPVPVAGSWIAVALAALGTIVLLAWPALRAARASDSSASSTRRGRLSGVLQRSGVDVAVFAIAAASYWQLRNLGDQRAATIRGRFGVDPLLVAAPAFGLVAGSFLALRFVPVAARLAERRIGRTRRAAVALTGWQLARRPHRYARAGLLVIMAIAIGTFAVAYEATWSRSQTAQAAHELGADGRLEPNRRTGDSLGALHMPTAIERVDGVRAALPVVSESARIPGTDRPARFVALDAARADVLNNGSRLRPQLDAALAALAERRPEIGGLLLPERPATIEIPFDVTARPVDPTSGVDDAGADHAGADHAGADHAGADHEGPGTFAASVTVAIRDGDDMLHRIDAGSIGTERSVAVAELTTASGIDQRATPRYPIAVIGIELSSVSQPPPSRDYEVRVGPIAAIGADGSRTPVPLVDTKLALRTETLGFLTERTSLAYGAEPPAGGVALAITTGSAYTPVSIHHTLEVIGEVNGGAAPTILSAVGSADWLTASNTEIGDVFPVSLGRVEDVRVQIVGVVDAVPTVDPATTDALLVDLPSLLAVEQRPGQSPRTISEYWFDLDPGGDPDALTRPPVDAVEVELLRDRERVLTSDPGAVGAIGAFLLGFGAAATFAVAGFVVTVMVSARERRGEFAVLRALGLAPSEHRRWMMLEQIVLVTAGAGLGTVLGVTLSHLVLPVVSLSQEGSGVFPSVVVIVPWRRVAVLELLTIGGLVAGIAVANLLRGPRWAGAAVRAGDDR